MNDTLSYTDLWRSLAPEERARACAAFWRSDDETTQSIRPTVLTALAGALRFRDKFLKTQPDAKKADWLLSRSNQSGFRAYHDSILRAWLLLEHGEMIERFLEVQAIPHEGCFMTGDPPPPSVESFRKGIGAIRKQWGDRSASLYLGFLLAEGPTDFCAALPAALEADGLRLGDMPANPLKTNH